MGVMADGRWLKAEVRSETRMKQPVTSNHKEMSTYLMDFGFGGFIGYGKGVSVRLVMEELNISMRYY